MIRTDDITTTSEYRAHQPELHAKLRETGRPIFITNRGKPEAVLLSPEAYDDLIDQAQLPEILSSIRRSEQELADGKGVDALAAIKQIAVQLGVQLDR